MRFLLGVANLYNLFPHLAHFSCHFSERVMDDALGIRSPKLRCQQLSPLLLLPFLSARSASLLSLSISYHCNMSEEAVVEELPALLAPLTSLQQLNVGHPMLSSASLAYLLTRPLDSLDLSASMIGLDSRQPPPIADVAECTLLQTCRTLQLPRQVVESEAWHAYFEAVVTEHSRFVSTIATLP